MGRARHVLAPRTALRVYWYSHDADAKGESAIVKINDALIEW